MGSKYPAKWMNQFFHLPTPFLYSLRFSANNENYVYFEFRSTRVLVDHKFDIVHGTVITYNLVLKYEY